MSSSIIKASTTDHMRLENHRNRMKRQNEVQIREQQNQHEDSIKRLIEEKQYQLEKLRDSYDLMISKEAQGMEESLHKFRIESEKTDRR